MPEPQQLGTIIGVLFSIQLIQGLAIWYLFHRGTIHLNGMNSAAFFVDGKQISHEAFRKYWNESLDEMRIK